MTDHDEVPQENYLHEARWALSKADGLSDPAHPSRPLLMQQAYAYATVSIAETARITEFRSIIEGGVWPMLEESERAAIMLELRELLHLAGE